MTKLIAYVIDGHTVDIRPSTLDRDWMDTTYQRYAYRCLPLNIANTHGWSLHLTSGFTASWNGGASETGISIKPDDGTIAPAVSHFGSGVLTFHVPVVFRTEPGFDLVVQAPANSPCDGIYPLTAVVETDWSPSTFTMNWMFTRPDHPIRFDRGDAYCQVYPIRRSDLTAIEPVKQRLTDDPALHAQYLAWSASRDSFNTGLRIPDSPESRVKWQKHYHQGRTLQGGMAVADEHRTKLRLPGFRDCPCESANRKPSSSEG